MESGEQYSLSGINVISVCNRKQRERERETLREKKE